MLGLAGSMLFSAASGAGAAAGLSVKVTPDIVPASAAGSPTGATVTIKYTNLSLNPNYSKANGIAIVECSPNVLASDPAACNQSPANLGQPGGPWVFTGNTKGSGKKTLALVSGAVGDGTCNPGGLCYIVIADPVTHAVLAPITPFGIDPTT
ncbi:MAG: hypothetical protein JWL83_125 [Actinomycetia bacterium]|nr:hypothetical protein [Actinomycetes bacterium]